MPNLLKLKRGTAATIPVGSAAEPLFTTDTYDLYIGKGNGSNQRFQKYIASGTSSQFIKGDGSLDSTSYQTALTFSSPLVNTSGTISIPAASGSVNGYLTSTDWTTFNNKQASLTLTTTGTSGAATLVGATLNIPQYQSVLTNPVTGTGTLNQIVYWTSTSQIGALTTATYPSLTELSYVKGVTSAIQTQLNAKEPTITAGTSLQYYRGDKTFQTLNTAEVPESGSIYFTEPRVLATVLTGLNLSGGGTIAATDSILTAFGKVQNQISALVGGVYYKGTWNASTNTPTLTSSSGTKGWYYIVTVAGSTNLDGITDWKVGDWAIFNGTNWDKVDNTDAVSSVNGFTGAVNLGLGDISNVTLTSPTNGQLLQFNGTSSKWVNWTPTYISGNQTITLSGDISGSGTTAITTTIGALKVTNAMLAGTIDYAKMDSATVPTWNQNTTGSAATLTTARTLTIGATGKTFNGSANVSWSLAEIGAFANPMTTLGDIIYGGASGAATRLAGNTVASKRFLTQTGDGTNSAAPSWGSIAAADVPTLNQNTTGSAATLTNPRNFTINGSAKSFDGSSNISWTASEIGLTSYLPLSGGTLTGALSGTSATFSSGIDITGTTSNQIRLRTAATEYYQIGRNASTGLLEFYGSQTGYTGYVFGGVDGTRLTISSTGAATFSSSVRYNDYLTIYKDGSNTIGAGPYHQVANAAGTNAIAWQLNASNGYDFWTYNGSAWSNKVTFTQGGNIGIGSNSPNALLTISGSATTYAGSANIHLYDVSASTSSRNWAIGNAIGGAGYGELGFIVSATQNGNPSGGTTILRLSATAATFSDNLTAGKIIKSTNAGAGFRHFYNNGTGNIEMSQRSDGKLQIYAYNGTAYSDILLGIDGATSGGNVGIGTTSPSYKLDITSLGYGIQHYGNSTNSLRTYAGSGYQIIEATTASTINQFGYFSGAFFIQTGGADKLTITSGGNVGIGTTSPAANLDIQTTRAANLTLLKLGTSNASTANGDKVNIDFYSYGNNYLNGRISREIEDFTTYAAALTFATGASGSVTERMRITSGGNIGIGSTTVSDKLDVYGAIRSSVNTNYYTQVTYSGGTLISQNTPSAETSDNFQFVINGGSSSTTGNAFVFKTQTGNTTPSTVLTIAKTGAATFSSSVTATSFFESSDMRLKSNIQNYKSNDILNISAKIYEKDGKTEVGYLAQDLENVLSSAISVRDNGYLDLSYRQVHTAKIAALEQEIKELKAKLK